MRPVAHQPITFVQDGSIPVPPPPEPTLGYGLLYNWYAATDERGIAPDGWRVPDGDDIDELFSSAPSIGSIRLSRTIEDGDPYWVNLSESNNSTLLSLLPAGQRVGINNDFPEFEGLYFNIRQNCFLLTLSTSGDKYRVVDIGAPNTDYEDTLFFYTFSSGVTVRCIRDTAPPSSIVTDADGNAYTWVQIGAQYWLAQNLRTTKYNNGDDIPTGLDNATWAAATDGAWAYPNGDATLPI